MAADTNPFPRLARSGRLAYIVQAVCERGDNVGVSVRPGTAE
jgi:hypothetical protein